jgi:hypothetical protein
VEKRFAQWDDYRDVFSPQILGTNSFVVSQELHELKIKKILFTATLRKANQIEIVQVFRRTPSNFICIQLAPVY